MRAADTRIRSLRNPRTTHNTPVLAPRQRATHAIIDGLGIIPRPSRGTPPSHPEGTPPNTMTMHARPLPSRPPTHHQAGPTPKYHLQDKLIIEHFPPQSPTTSNATITTLPRLLLSGARPSAHRAHHISTALCPSAMHTNDADDGALLVSCLYLACIFFSRLSYRTVPIE